MPIAASRADRVVVVSRRRPDDAILSGAEWRALDLLDSAAVDALVADICPDAIISAAAANPADGASFAVNEVGTAAVAAASSRRGARLVHVSTDVVHGGGTPDGNPDAPYADDAEPTPINDYGRSKAAGERAVLEQCPSAVVVRTSLIYGTDRIDRGTEGFVARLASGQRLSLWGDAIRQPVWADALADGLVSLALDLADVAGPLNLVGDEAMSRAEFGRRLLAHWGVDGADRIDETRAADLVGQPLDLRLDLTRARSLGLAVPGVTQVLAASQNRRA